MSRVDDRKPTYCTPDDVAETIDLPDRNGDTIYFTDETHPSYSRVCKLICGIEDEIDRRVRRSWRVNIVKDYVTDVTSYQWDEDGWRSGYYQQGGSVVNLRKDIVPWDPNPQYTFHRDCDGQMILEDMHDKDGNPLWVKGRTGGDIIYDDETGDPKLEYVDLYLRPDTPDTDNQPVGKGYIPLYTGEPDGQFVQVQAPVPDKLIYEGDRLFVRSKMNDWIDISHNLGAPTDSGGVGGFWFDYKAGRMFIRSRYFAPRFNAVKITYRYGSSEPVPMAINRLTCLLTASQIVNMSAFFVKVGVGGDIANVKEAMLRNWEVEAGRIFSSYQRIGTVHTWHR